jgi:DnaD/phage-associated family protein
LQNGWSKNKIKTYEELEQYFEKVEKLNGLKKEVVNKLRILRPLNSFEEEYISKWTDEYGYGIDIIELALKRSVLKSNAGFKYYDELLTDWHSKGLTTPDQIETHLASLNEKKARSKQVQTMAKQYEFTQSTFDGFDDLYDN